MFKMRPPEYVLGGTELRTSLYSEVRNWSTSLFTKQTLGISDFHFNSQLGSVSTIWRAQGRAGGQRAPLCAPHTRGGSSSLGPETPHGLCHRPTRLHTCAPLCATHTRGRSSSLGPETPHWLCHRPTRLHTCSMAIPSGWESSWACTCTHTHTHSCLMVMTAFCRSFSFVFFLVTRQIPDMPPGKGHDKGVGHPCMLKSVWPDRPWVTDRDVKDWELVP